MSKHMGKPDVTVVVATYNRVAMLSQGLGSLVVQETNGALSFEIVVVDDASTDNTEELVMGFQSRAPDVDLRYIKEMGSGVAVARNKGVAMARGSWIAFFDDDQVADSSWLYELFKTANSREFDCVGGSVALRFFGDSRPDLGPKTRRLLGEKDLCSIEDNAAPQDYLGTGNLLIRKSVFEKVGGFDVSFLRGGSDSDFLFKLQKAGRIGFAPSALVHHLIAESRLVDQNLRWICLKRSFTSARIDRKYRGYLGLSVIALMRIGIAIVRDLPLLITAKILDDRARELDSRCGLWYARGYVRSALYWLTSKSFFEPDFARGLDFRRYGGGRPAVRTQRMEGTQRDG